MSNYYNFHVNPRTSNVNNQCARKSVKWHTLLEVFSGETPDLDIFRHAFHTPVWYREWCLKTGEVRMFKGGFWVLHGMSVIPSALKSLMCMKNPRKIARFSTKVLFYHVTLTQHLKAKCYCTLRTSTFQLLSRMMPLPTFKGQEIQKPEEIVDTNKK